MISYIIRKINFLKKDMTSDWGIKIKPHIPMHTDEYYRQRNWILTIQEMKISTQKMYIFDAILNMHHERLNDLVTANRKLLESLNKQGLTPLMYAVTVKNYEAMRILLNHGADANVTDHDGWSAYSWAVFIKDKRAQELLSRYTSVFIDSKDVSGVVFGLCAG